MDNTVGVNKKVPVSIRTNLRDKVGSGRAVLDIALRFIVWYSQYQKKEKELAMDHEEWRRLHPQSMALK